MNGMRVCVCISLPFRQMRSPPYQPTLNRLNPPYLSLSLSLSLSQFGEALAVASMAYITHTHSLSLFRYLKTKNSLLTRPCLGRVTDA